MTVGARSLIKVHLLFAVVILYDVNDTGANRRMVIESEGTSGGHLVHCPEENQVGLCDF